MRPIDRLDVNRAYSQHGVAAFPCFTHKHLLVHAHVAELLDTRWLDLEALAFHMSPPSCDSAVLPMRTPVRGSLLLAALSCDSCSHRHVVMRLWYACCSSCLRQGSWAGRRSFLTVLLRHRVVSRSSCWCRKRNGLPTTLRRSVGIRSNDPRLLLVLLLHVSRDVHAPLLLRSFRSGSATAGDRGAVPPHKSCKRHCAPVARAPS